MIGSVQSQLLTGFLFVLFMSLTLWLTYRSSKQSHNAGGFYVAGRGLSAWKNGLAISGDYMSAASFLGIAGLVSLYGFDGLMYSFGFIVGWIFIVLLVAEPLRNAGRYTLSDLMAYRLRPRPVRAAAAASSVIIGMFYLLAQLVGAGAITSLLLPVKPEVGIIVVGFLMIVYVLFGGMLATTYVQMVKAVLVLATSILLTFLVFSHFDFSLSNLLDAASVASGRGDAFLLPGLYFRDRLDLISLGLALALGTAGLPHIMMRFYTVPTAKDARRSANWVIGVVGLYLLMTTFLGFAAAALVGHTEIIAANKAGNSAAPLLALYLGGGAQTFSGNLLLSFVTAVTLSTILAVVAGLIMAAASNISHDLYHHVIRRGEMDDQGEVKVAKLATLGIGILAIVLAIAVKSLNVAFLVGLAFAVAASANLPVILYSLFWRRFNTTGALAALVTGIGTSVGLVLVSPAIVGPTGIIFPQMTPLVGLVNPGIISIPLGFLAGWLGSVLTTREQTSELRFDELRQRTLTGYGAESSAVNH